MVLAQRMSELPWGVAEEIGQEWEWRSLEVGRNLVRGAVFGGGKFTWVGVERRVVMFWLNYRKKTEANC